MAAHQAPPPLGFSRQENWNGLPFPSPMHESEKWPQNCQQESTSKEQEENEKLNVIWALDKLWTLITLYNICLWESWLKAEEKGTTEDKMVGWHHFDAHEFGWTLGVADGQRGLVCCDSWGCKESDTTERQLNWICSLYLFINLKGWSWAVNSLPIRKSTLPSKTHIFCAADSDPCSLLETCCLFLI